MSAQVECPNPECGKSLQIPEGGGNVQCPHCRHVFSNGQPPVPQQALPVGESQLVRPAPRKRSGRWAFAIVCIAGLVIVSGVGIFIAIMPAKQKRIEPTLPPVTKETSQAKPKQGPDAASTGWASDEEIAKRLAKGRKRLTVGQAGGDFRTLHEAISVVADGATIEILDSHTYRQPPVDGRNKKGITLKTIQGAHPTIVAEKPGEAGPEDPSGALICGDGWTISGIRFASEGKVPRICGILAGPDCTKLRVEGCQFEKIPTAISFSGSGECYVRDSVFADCKVAIGSHSKSTQPMRFVLSHCVILGCESLLSACRPHPYHFAVWNSVIAETSSSVYVDRPTDQAPAARVARGKIKADHNCYHKIAGLYQWLPEVGKAAQLEIGDLEAWRKQTKNDKHSIATDPKLINPVKGDFYASTDSPCLNKATDGWDIGLTPRPSAITPARLHAALKATNPAYNGSGEFLVRDGIIQEVRLLFAGVSNLSVLKHLPLTTLVLVSNPITDISALRGMPLEHLCVLGCPLQDISVIKGMPLIELALAKTNVADLSPIKDMPLIFLIVSETNVSDISVLRELEDPKKLQWLIISDTGVTDLSVLEGLEGLDVLAIPKDAKDIAFLRRFRNLSRLDTEYDFADETMRTAEQFWKDHDGKEQGAMEVAPAASSPKRRGLPALVKRIRPSVVYVMTYDKKDNFRSSGSGFFVNKKGDVITNLHVIQDASRISIRTADGMMYPVKGTPVKGKNVDLALLSVSMPQAAVRPLSLSDSLPELGETIVVIGSPLGFEGTVSHGLVSGIRLTKSGKLIQISAPISRGSSGSPVVDLEGNVVGVAMAGMDKGQNINFAIPAQKVLELGADRGQ